MVKVRWNTVWSDTIEQIQALFFEIGATLLDFRKVESDALRLLLNENK